MFRITLSCHGVSEAAALAALPDIVEEFGERPWQQNIQCRWDGKKIVLVGDSAVDATGEALRDEFSDVVCACVPIEDSTISFEIEDVRVL
jgi:hypothetical protein